MKSISSKILSLMLLACVCANVVSCKSDKDEPESSKPNYSQVAGVWHLYSLDGAEKVPTDVYFVLKADGTAGFCSLTGSSDVTYVYGDGTFTYGTKVLAVYPTYYHHFYIRNNVVRRAVDFEDGSVYYNFSILSQTSYEIEAEANRYHVYLIKEPLPSYWLSVFMEQEIKPTSYNLVSQWNMVSSYVVDHEGNYDTKYYYYPEQEGITLMDNGALGNCGFWANQVWSSEYAAGRLNETDGVSIYASNCNWTLSGYIFSLTCAAYDRVQYNAAGTEIARQQVIPATPIRIGYDIIVMSDSWLVLKSPLSQMYYCFLRSNNGQSYQPAYSPATKSKFAVQKGTIKKGHLTF